QIGEFSFILAALGVSLGLLPREGQSLIVAGALISITINPLSFAAVDIVDRWILARPKLLSALERPAEAAPVESDGGGHVETPPQAVIVGYGRVGRAIGDALARNDVPFVAVDRDHRTVVSIRQRGVHAQFGDGARPGILEHAGIAHARLLVVTAPEPFQARQIVSVARRANPEIDCMVRTHTAEEQAYLERLAVGRVVMGEHELALRMA